MTQLHVVQFQRYPIVGNYSVERIFEDVRAQMPSDLSVSLRVNKHPSIGVSGRLKDALSAARVRADVRHITGDVHYLAWFMPARGTLLTILDCVTLERLDGAKRLLFKMLWYDWPIARARRLSTISTFSARSIESFTGYPADQIAIIPPPLSSEFVRSDKPFNAQKPRILQVGTSENKNLYRVIDAIKGLNIRLVIIGKLGDEQLRRLKEADIEFENYVGLSREKLISEYEKADILIFASLYEGFGMPIVEAQAIGRPVITSNVCSMPEVANGAALLVDPHNTGAIRDAICEITTNLSLRNTLLSKGFENARRFGAGAIAEQYAALYRGLAA